MAKRKTYTYQPADWEARFLELYAGTGNVTISAQGAGIQRSTVYERRKAYPHFAKLMDDAREQALEVLEGYAWKRAKDNSDTLLIFLLKSLKPDVYGDRLRVTYDKETIEALKRFEQKLGVPLHEALLRMEAELDNPNSSPLH